jgi:hypothetical protein
MSDPMLTWSPRWMQHYSNTCPYFVLIPQLQVLPVTLAVPFAVPYSRKVASTEVL